MKMNATYETNSTLVSTLLYNDELTYRLISAPNCRSRSDESIMKRRCPYVNLELKNHKNCVWTIKASLRQVPHKVQVQIVVLFTLARSLFR